METIESVKPIESIESVKPIESIKPVEQISQIHSITDKLSYFETDDLYCEFRRILEVKRNTYYTDIFKKIMLKKIGESDISEINKKFIELINIIEWTDSDRHEYDGGCVMVIGDICKIIFTFSDNHYRGEDFIHIHPLEYDSTDYPYSDGISQKGYNNFSVRIELYNFIKHKLNMEYVDFDKFMHYVNEAFNELEYV
jgi:hypothetical protein